MSAILLIKGPVCTKTCISQYGPPAMRGINITQFLNAAQALQEANLGSLITFPSGFMKLKKDVFIKKAPSEIGDALLGANLVAMDMNRYKTRFNMPAPTSVNQTLRDELIAGGFVKQEYFVDPEAYMQFPF